MENENGIDKDYSTYDLHQMLNERAGEKISEYDMRTLLECWRLHRRIFSDVEQTGFSKEEALHFLEYAY
jgi:hypothetical protein